MNILSLNHNFLFIKQDHFFQRAFMECLLWTDSFNYPAYSLINMIKKYNIYMKQIHLEFAPKHTK